MALHEARSDTATLGDETQSRTTAPVAEADAHHPHGHDDCDHDHYSEDGHDHEHAFEWPVAARIGLVALAAVLVWFQMWEPSKRQRDRGRRPAGRRLADFQGGV